jgi:AraC-like DNA-binding protein
MINDKPVIVGNASPLKQHIEVTDEIELDNNQSSFSFKMAALSFFNPQKNRIKYKLNGYDKDWKLAGPDQMAIYSGIPSGSYEFSFMVSNEDGVWNTKEKRVKIIIARPVWLSAWALLGYFILGAVIISFVFFRTRKKEEVMPAETAGPKKDKKAANHEIIQPAEVETSPADLQFLQRAIVVVEENMSDPEFNVQHLSEKLFISRAQLYRKINAITGVTINDFIKEIRLKRAAQLILQKPGNISEIAYQVGFNDPKYFSKCFKQQFGVPPGNYKAPDERNLPPE